MKARPSLDKRRRELKLQERRQEKAEKRKVRKENRQTGDGVDAMGAPENEGAVGGEEDNPEKVPPVVADAEIRA